MIFSDELLGFYQVNKAENWDEFKTAFKTYSVPGQNFVYGDKEGNIGYMFGGKIPIRKSQLVLHLFSMAQQINMIGKGLCPVE